MKMQELSLNEMKAVNGGLLGLFGNDNNGSSSSLTNLLSLNFSNSTMDDDGSSSHTTFGLNIGYLASSVMND